MKIPCVPESNQYAVGPTHAPTEPIHVEFNRRLSEKLILPLKPKPYGKVDLKIMNDSNKQIMLRPKNVKIN